MTAMSFSFDVELNSLIRHAAKLRHKLVTDGVPTTDPRWVLHVSPMTRDRWEREGQRVPETICGMSVRYDGGYSQD